MLILGDNLETLPIWVRDESVDLVYLDPPFNSNATYNMLFKHVDGTPAAAQIRAFDDSWQWNAAAAEAYDDIVRGGGETARVMHGFWDILDGPCTMLAYLSMMAPRLVELRRVLKPTGSLYLHCDPTASHYLKLLLDAVFGVAGFRNEIVWHYQTFHGNVKLYWPKKHDTLFFYTKGDVWDFTQLFDTDVDDTIDGGRWRKYLTAESTIIGSNMPMQDTRFTRYYRRWVRENGREPGPDDAVYEVKGQAVDTVWDIKAVDPKDLRERLGYPTQKPLALLDRIIRASCPEDGVVLDPFCGCGTTIDAAQRLGRKWIGIDVSRLATDVIEARLHKQYPGLTWSLRVFPPTIEEAERLAETDRHAFQEWACYRIGAAPGGKGADRGIDGTIDGYVNNQRWRALVSVESGTHVNVAELRDLAGTVQREGAQSGIFLTLYRPPSTFSREVAEAGVGDLRIPRLQVLTIADLFAGIRPVVPAPHGVAQFDASERTVQAPEVVAQSGNS